MTRVTEETWTTRRLLTWTTGHFERLSMDHARLAAEMLLGHVLGVERLKLYLDPERPASGEERARFRALVERASRHEPVDYLVGHAPFYGMQLRVDRRVLIPRPSTETLVDRAVEFARSRGGSVSVADVGTGSGAIALAVARAVEGARVVATDLHEGPLALAKENAEALGMADRVDFRRGDLLDALGDERFDVVASNPPYIPTGDLAGLEPNVREHEPHAALDGGEDGLDLIRRLIAGSPAHLASGGMLLLEYNGETQTAVMTGLLADAGYWETPEILRDHEGLERVVAVQLRG